MRLHQTLVIPHWRSNWVVIPHVLFLFLNLFVLLVASLALAFSVLLRQWMPSVARSTAPAIWITRSRRLLVVLVGGLILFTKASAIVKCGALESISISERACFLAQSVGL